MGSSKAAHRAGRQPALWLIQSITMPICNQHVHPVFSSILNQFARSAMQPNRNLLMSQGMTWDEAEAELKNLASDAHDQEQDRRAEEYFRNRNQDQGAQQ
jgi:hypothetical protein